jgi:hypothetical protein
MPGLQDFSDLAFMLHPADAGPLAGARVEDDKWTLARVNRDARRRFNPDKHIVYRPIERPAVK